MSALSSLTNDDLNKKDIISLFENINSPDLQQVVKNNNNLSHMFAYAAVASMAQQFVSSASTPNQLTMNSSKRFPKKVSQKMNELKLNKNFNKTHSASCSSVNKFLGVLKQEPKAGTEAEIDKNNLTTSNTTEINDFWSNMTTVTTKKLSNFNLPKTELEINGNNNKASSINSTVIDNLPKESDLGERKRPAAIQELLQMKKARLSHVLAASTEKRVKFF